MKRLLIIIAILIFAIGFAKHFQKDLAAFEHDQVDASTPLKSLK